MKKINLKDHYFLLNNGYVIFWPFKEGLYPGWIAKEDDVVKIKFGNVTSDNYDLLEIIGSSKSAMEIEKMEVRYFTDHPELTNEFYKALTGKKHTFPFQKWGEKMPKEHVEALRNLNRIRLFEEFIKGENNYE